MTYRAASAFTFAQTSAAPPGAEYRVARCDNSGSVPSPIVNQRACTPVVFFHLATPCRFPVAMLPRAAAKHLSERISLADFAVLSRALRFPQRKDLCGIPQSFGLFC